MKNIFYPIIIFAFIASQASAVLSVQNGSVSNLTITNVTLYGELVSTNTTNAVLTCYYGAGNGGTNPVLWQYSNSYGQAATTGLVSIVTTNLTPATWYYFQWCASETTNTAWASSASNFTTLARAPTSYPTAGAGKTMIADTNGHVLFPTNPIFPAITLGGETRSNWLGYTVLNLDWLSIGPTNMLDQSLVARSGTNQAFLSQGISGDYGRPSLTNYASVQAVQSGSGIDWTTPENIVDTNHANTAQVTLTGGATGTSKVVRVSGFNFDVPENAVVRGVKVYIEHSSPGTGSGTVFVQLWNGNDGATSAVSQEAFSVGLGKVTGMLGSEDSIWGLSSLSVPEVNASEFSVNIWIEGAPSTTDTFSLYTVVVRVFYSTQLIAWRSGVNSNGHYQISSDNAGITPVDIFTNGSIAFATPVSVPSITLGTNPPITDWPAGGGSGTFDHTALTNVNGDANVQHLTAAEKAIATNPPSTNGLASTNWVVAQGYATNVGTYNHVSLTNVNGDANVQHLTAAEKAIATNPPSTNGLASTNWVIAQGYSTNANADLSGWSTNRATHSIYWAMYRDGIDIASTGALSPDVSGRYLFSHVTNNFDHSADRIVYVCTNGYMLFPGNFIGSDTYRICAVTNELPYIFISSSTNPVTVYTAVDEVSSGAPSGVVAVAASTNMVSIGQDANVPSNLVLTGNVVVASFQLGTNSPVTNWPTAGISDLPITNDLIAATGSLDTAVGNLADATNVLNASLSGLVASSSRWDKGATDSVLATNMVRIASNAYVAADVVVRVELTNIIAVASNAATAASTVLKADVTNRIAVVSNMVDALNVSTGAINSVANAALPASATNALEVTTLQITGGSPTTGSVFVATNTAGKAAWKILPKIHAKNIESTVYTAAQWINCRFPTLIDQISGQWDGTNWTPGVVGYIISTCSLTPSSGGEDDVSLNLQKNGVNIGGGWQRSATLGSGINCTVLTYNDKATNVFRWQFFSYLKTITNTPTSYFSGAVLP